MLMETLKITHLSCTFFFVFFFLFSKYSLRTQLWRITKWITWIIEDKDTEYPEVHITNNPQMTT